MPTFERGDMWEVFGKTGMFLLTTNPIRRKDGAIVMGRGIAKQAKDRFPQLPYDFGKAHEDFPYNVGRIGTYEGQDVGWFMVKEHWREPALPDKIKASVQELNDRIRSGSYALWRIDLNFPGIGNGKLSREDVLPLLAPLPDNVHVWEYET
jgi:hypothetical protein